MANGEQLEIIKTFLTGTDDELPHKTGYTMVMLAIREVYQSQQIFVEAQSGINQQTEDDMKDLNNIVFGTKTDRSDGFMNRIRKNEDFRTKANRVFWIIITPILAGGGIFGLISFANYLNSQ